MTRFMPDQRRQIPKRRSSKKNCEILHERIPLRDMSDCLLAVYDEVSRRALQRGVAGGAREGSDQENWKAAEDDLFARISVDFEESGANLYALASLPGCVGGEITVAVDESWLLISGYAEQACRPVRRRTSPMARWKTPGLIMATTNPQAKRNCWFQVNGRSYAVTTNDVKFLPHRAARSIRTCPASCVGAPRPFCVVALRAKVDPGRSVAVLSNGLLAIRMGKARLDTSIPRVA